MLRRRGSLRLNPVVLRRRAAGPRWRLHLPRQAPSMVPSVRLLLVDHRRQNRRSRAEVRVAVPAEEGQARDRRDRNQWIRRLGMCVPEATQPYHRCFCAVGRRPLQQQCTTDFVAAATAAAATDVGHRGPMRHRWRPAHSSQRLFSLARSPRRLVPRLTASRRTLNGRCCKGRCCT